MYGKSWVPNMYFVNYKSELSYENADVGIEMKSVQSTKMCRYGVKVTLSAF